MERRRPSVKENMTAATTENLAVRGCPAPSSLDTLTLHLTRTLALRTRVSKLKYYVLNSVICRFIYKKSNLSSLVYTSTIFDRPCGCVSSKCHHVGPPQNVHAARYKRERN